MRYELDSWEKYGEEQLGDFVEIEVVGMLCKFITSIV